MAITRKNSKSNKRNKRMSKNTKKTSKRSNSSKRNVSKNRKVRKTRKSVKGVKKMKGGGEIIHLQEYFPIDTGDIFSKIVKINYILETHYITLDIKYNFGSNYYINLPDNYYYVIVNSTNYIKELLIFKINDNNLYKIFTINQKTTSSLGTVITEPNIITHDITEKLTFVSGLPVLPWVSYHIFKINDNYDTIKTITYSGYSLFSSKYNTLLNKDTFTGYYNLNPKQISPPEPTPPPEPEPTLKPTPAKKPGFFSRFKRKNK